MTSLRVSVRWAFTASFLALLFLGGPSPQPAGGQARAAGKKDVSITLKVSDKTAGLTLEAKKLVTADTNAFDFVRHTLAVSYRTDPDGGPIVTSLCGVSAPRGLVWTAYLDGKPCKGGLGRVTFEKDAVLEWKTEKPEAP